MSVQTPYELIARSVMSQINGFAPRVQWEGPVKIVEAALLAVVADERAAAEQIREELLKQSALPQVWHRGDDPPVAFCRQCNRMVPLPHKAQI